MGALCRAGAGSDPDGRRASRRERHTTLLLLAYAAGAATSLALALLIGGRVLAALKQSLGVGEWIRRGVGVAVLAAVAAIALGLDTGFLTRVSLASTAPLEQRLLDTFHPARCRSAIAIVRRDERRPRDDERQSAMMSGNRR